MITLRFLGIVLIFFITWLISVISNIDLMHVIMIVTFTLTSDLIMCRFLVKVYMTAIANDQKNKDKNDE